MPTGTQLRELFLQYFAEQGHARVASSSLVPQNDKTLLFTNAGMVQFKDVFMGVEKRPYVRAASSQKCLRLSGKHNDLENVGRTARHNTFFEMLGNFSFGDYFKADAIEFAWEFLTRRVGLDPDRMVVSVFGGDPQVPAVPPDDEARNLWKKVTGFGDERVLGLGWKDNFWQMGDTGPCGPCTEIHYFLGPDPDLSLFGLEPEGGRGWTEIWNLVFMQFERFGDGTMRPLPKPSVDTGMGLERLTMVVQDSRSNFETDLMFPLVELAQELTGKSYGEREADDVSMRVLADHARAVAFLLADGVLPSNKDQGFALRQVLRRALRHGRLLGLNDPFFTRFTGVVVDLFGQHYPELREHQQKTDRIILLEEQRFAKALSKGLEVLGGFFDELRKHGETELSGRKAFLLHDTFGFPLDLTLETAKDTGFSVDVTGFDAEMERQRSEAREARVVLAKIDPVLRDLVSSLPRTEFLGYVSDESDDSEVLALVRDGQPCKELAPGVRGEVVLDRSPFYAEAGGQIGDVGLLRWEGGEARVSGTFSRIPGYVFHVVEVRQGRLAEGTKCHAVVDAELRNRTRLNHTATHLMHAALREVLGEHVKQAGSYVGPDRLRFDFTHFAALDPEEIERVEELTNRKIRENIEVCTDVMDLDEALRTGAMALFGEKYADKVRVLRIGDFSTELCGGTHARRSGDIGLFKIVSEESVKAGVRRIEAVTGHGALARIQQESRALRDAGQIANAAPHELAARLESLLQQVRAHEKEIARLKSRLASGDVGAAEKLVPVGDVQVLARTVEALDESSLSNLADELKSKVKSGVVLLFNRQPDRVNVVATLTKDLASRLDAIEIVRAVAGALGGKGGGGRKDFARAGGKDPDKIGAALDAAVERVRAQLA